MRSNASLCAALFLLAGCVGHGSSEFSAEAAPVAGPRGMADDPYARPDPALDPYAAPAQDPYARQQPARDPYAQPEPQQQDAYARPGADYARPDSRPDNYSAPAQSYRDPGADM